MLNCRCLAGILVACLTCVSIPVKENVTAGPEVMQVGDKNQDVHAAHTDMVMSFRQSLCRLPASLRFLLGALCQPCWLAAKRNMQKLCNSVRIVPPSALRPRESLRGTAS